MARTPPEPPDDLPPEDETVIRPESPAEDETVIRRDVPPDEETVVRDDAWVEDAPPPPATERRAVQEEVVEEPYEVVEEPPPDRNFWPWLVLLLVLVLGGLAALWYFTQEDEPETKPVPNVVRLTEADARARLEDEGFEVEVVRAANEAPVDTVFAQDPSGGSELEEGETVTIEVLSGPAAVDVPNVVGLPADQAEQRLEDAGLTANPVGVFSEEPPGTVVAQNPAAGEQAAENSAVRVNVSRGTGRVEVPDVVGRSADEATSILGDAGLEANPVQVPSAEPEGTVVAQSPAAGSELARGESVRINVSNGEGAQEPEDVEVPDVTDLPEAEAVTQLEDAGFTVRIRREEVTDPTLDGVVVSQDPEANATAERGSEVAITVGEVPPIE